MAREGAGFSLRPQEILLLRKGVCGGGTSWKSDQHLSPLIEPDSTSFQGHDDLFSASFPYSTPILALPEGLQESQDRPLLMCLRHEDFDLAFLLLTKGADPRSVSLMEGDTPLHAALHIFLDINGEQSISGEGSWILEMMLCSLIWENAI